MKFLELKIPPAVLFLISAGLMWGVSIKIPTITWKVPGNRWIGLTLFIIGVGIGLAAVAQFRLAKTTVDPHHPEKTTSIVNAGIYKLSRNPMYLGLLLGLMGWAVYLSNLLNIFLLVGFVIYMNRFQIIPEERTMTKKFGEEFAEYKKSVRRWI